MVQKFTAKDWKITASRHPVEDSYLVNKKENIIAVADGVTRDPMAELPNIDTLKGKLKFTMNYPRPSPARIVSDIFCQSFLEVLRDYTDANQDAIRKAFQEANTQIASWNAKNISNPDYLTKDLAGCVASGVFEDKETISWGYLTDCGVAIFDKNGKLKFRTENQGPDKHDPYIWQDLRLKGKEWENPHVRRIIRRDYRNNPFEEHSFGVLTGEEDAMNYVRTGTQEFIPGDHLVVYSDGLDEVIFSDPFARLIRENDDSGIERICKKEVKTEGTLIHKVK